MRIRRNETRLEDGSRERTALSHSDMLSRCHTDDMTEENEYSTKKVFM